jgi:hypothetical protein
MAVVAPSPQPSHYGQQTLKSRGIKCHLGRLRATLSKTRQHTLRTHKPTRQISCALPKGPAHERHLLILDSHTSEADGLETHNTSRKLPSGICDVKVLARDLATRKAFGSIFRESASRLRSTMRDVDDQIRGTR